MTLRALTALLAAGLACDAPDDPEAKVAAPAEVAAPLSADVPDDRAAISGWLHALEHRAWEPQSPVRATSEHGGARVLFNATLAASMRAGAAEHPIGAAAVREIYAPDLATLRGFGMMLKTGPSGQAGEGWYWYEVFATSPTRPVVAQVGARGCVTCHEGGVDFVHPPAPR